MTYVSKGRMPIFILRGISDAKAIAWKFPHHRQQSDSGWQESIPEIAITSTATPRTEAENAIVLIMIYLLP